MGLGDVVILDNSSSHKPAAVREAIQPGSASLVYLPLTVSTSSPLEQAFAKIKWLVKILAKRTVEALW